MQKVLIFFSNHPWWVIAAILALCLIAAGQLRDVEVHISAEELLVIDDPARAFSEEIRQRFGDEKVVLLVMEDPDLLAREKLEVLKSVIDELEALPFVDRVESLFSVPHLKTVDGYLDKEPYLAKLPESPETSRELVDQALINPFVKHVLLSPDGQAMAAAIVLKDETNGSDDYSVTQAVGRVTDALAGHYQDVFSVGFPHVRTEIADKIRQEQGNLVPLAIAALLVTLFILLRQLVDILTPILTAGISILWTLGAMGPLGIPLNVVTSMVPILLIVIGSTEDIHLLSEFRQGQKRGLDTRKAIHYMSRKMGRTVTLTFITTYAGFLSVGLSRIEVLWQFGILASTGLLFNFLVTISLVPALLTITGRWQLDGKARFFGKYTPKVAERYWTWLQKYRWVIYVVLGLSTAAVALGIPRIQVNHSAIDSLARDSQVREHVASLNARFAGLESFSIVLDSGIQDTFLKVRYLEEIDEIQAFVEKRGLSHSTTSFADYLSVLNGAFQELERPRMPYSDDEITELMVFLDYRRVSAYVTEDYSSARILIRHDISSTRQLQDFVDGLQAFIDTHLDPGLEARITGDSVLTLSATHAMIGGQLQSIFLLLAFIVLIISLLFMDLRVGLLAALPNALPVIVLFGVMGYAGIPLNIATTMAAAIAIGIAVDDTLHFMLRYNQEIRSSKSQSWAMRTTIYAESLPVLSTSVALIGGFLVFTSSDFEPVALFGLLGALVIGTALVADFVITPLAISSLRLVTLWDLLSLRLRQEVIPESSLFKGMRPWQIRRFILSSTVVDFATDEHVFRRDEESNELYLVMNGLVEVSVPGQEDGKGGLVVDRFSPGEMFGDVALLAGERRKTNAVALKATTVLVLTREAISNTTHFHPIIAAKLFLNLATDVSRRWVGFVSKLNESKGAPVTGQGEDERNEEIP